MRGVVGVLATPFDEHDRIDSNAMRANVRESLAFGVSGFLVPANVGEVQQLSPAERTLVVETVLEETAGRVPVIGGATAADQSGRIAAAKNLMRLGCRTVLAHVPYSENEPEAYERNILELADTGMEMLMVQEADPVSPGAPVEVIARLHQQIPAFRWLKCEVNGRYRKISALREALGDSLLIGTAGPEYIEALDRGADAYMPTVFHDIYVRIFQWHNGGQRQRARELFHKFLPVLAFSYSHNIYQFNKKMLVRRGIFPSARLRVDLPLFDEWEERLADELIEDAMRLSESLVSVDD
jgi:4-hydroxy-tetrahydrodipicolinate synthase